MIKTFFIGIIGVFILVNGGPAYCRQPDIIFNKVLPPGGKSFVHVTGIVQDRNGNMWFSTKKGLFSFDGAHWTRYKNDPLNQKSLASNQLESICIDSSGYIWIGTMDAGLDRFDPATGVFRHFRNNPQNAHSVSQDYIAALFTDREGILWIGTGSGLDRYNAANDSFEHFINVPRDSSSLSCNDVRVIYEDREGTLWIGTGSPYDHSPGDPERGGLNKMNKASGTFTRYMHDPLNPNTLVNNKVRAIFEDSRGTFWVGTAGDGLHTMDRKTGNFIHYPFDPKHPERLSRPALNHQIGSNDHISFIHEDAAGGIWIGAAEAGINHYDPGTGKVVHFESGNDPEHVFTDDSAWWAFTSKDGVLWISTLTGGLYRIVLREFTFPYYPLHRQAVCFYQSPAGALWIGTDRGLLQQDIQNGGIQYVYPGLHDPAFIDDYICLIRQEGPDKFWIGGSEGLALVSDKAEETIRYRHEPANPASLSNDIVIAFCADDSDHKWVGTMIGLNLLDAKTGKVKRYYLDPQDTMAGYNRNMILDIFKDHYGNIWFRTLAGGGLYRFDREHDAFKKYADDLAVSSLYEDSEQVLWIGSDDGLFRYDRSADRFIHFEDKNSLTDFPQVRSIVEDDRKNLWLATVGGMIKINPQRTESRVFGKAYGLEDVEMLYNSQFKDSQGKLYFGEISGYISFNPSDLDKDATPPLINLKAVKLENETERSGYQDIASDRLASKGGLHLPKSQNTFSFEFNTIDFTYPEENHTIYLLENYDLTWREAGSEHRAYYFNVPPGKYTFRVKGVNGLGIWAEKKLDLVILPPWWRSWWAYALYGLFLIAGIFGVDRFQRRRLLLAERERTRKKELAQAKEIEKAYKELKSTQSQLIHAEKMASLGELTAGIAHEIQNPLNFVNNFSEVSIELIDELKQESGVGGQRTAVDGRQTASDILDDVRENLQKINHHGKRADAIVKGMLQHSRASSGIKEPTDLNLLADEYLRLAYHGFRAKDKSFNVTMNAVLESGLPKVNVVPQEIGRVLLNLISNAFYAVDKKRQHNAETQNFASLQAPYTPTVSVITRNLGDRVEIRVRDNGDGIPADIRGKIFQPFFTTKPAGEGTGLGLSLSYDIIKAHGGGLKVESWEGEGTEFIIRLSV